MANPKLDWRAIVADEMLRHPNMTPADLHKLVYQAVHGGNHLLCNPQRFRAALRAEWNALQGTAVRLDALQCIHPNGKTARLHLSPCKARGCDIEALTAFLISQPHKTAGTEDLVAAWNELRRLAGAGRIPFSELALSFSPDREIGHHSASYGSASYRIVHDLTDPITQEKLCQLGLQA